MLDFGGGCLNVRKKRNYGFSFASYVELNYALLPIERPARLKYTRAGTDRKEKKLTSLKIAG